MGVSSLLLLALSAVGAPLGAQPAEEGRPGTAAAPGVYAFVGVNVLPMDREGVDLNRTVVVRDGVIETVGPADDVDVPPDATVIDGGGRWLMPGLAEMHAHVPPVQGDGWPDREAVEDMLFLYVANGITTIRGMLGAPYQLELAEMLAGDELLGPTFYVGAPSVNGGSAPDPETAERLVRLHAETGYHLQKIHPGLSRATWDRMAEVARQEGLSFAGHVPQAVGLRHALATGMSTVDHLDGYVPAVATSEIRERLLAGGNVSLADVVASATPERIGEVARLTREAGAWVVPTMYLWENLYGAPDADALLSAPEMRYVSAGQRAAWRRQSENRPSLPSDVVTAHNELRKEILRALAREGAGILMGTDSPQMFNVPGFALHRELEVMEDAGLTRFQILESGTANVAGYVEKELGLDGAFGTVAAGRRADLVLLEANPLDDLDHLDRRAGVMVRGRWVPADEIAEGLARLAEKHGG
jgi:imidazolonepropionase-like amidohydrolase